MKKWEILDQDNADRAAISIENILKIILKNRGLTTTEEVAEFISPKFEDLTIASVGIDAAAVKKTVTRLQKAIEKKEQIIIYGDYDVDGITSSAILWETLHSLHASVMPYIPHRVDEGYGLSIPGIENVLIKFPETKIIITVDNGIVANAAVDFANGKGIEVIVTDHHVPSETLPAAYTIVHTTKLCGAGVAYLLAQELKKSRHADGRDDGIGEDDLLELATLGTIADLVPLKDGNRIIVKYGLPKLRMTRRPGLLAMFAEAKVDSQAIGVYDIGHIIAPRLNATGRMASAMDSLRLLCTKDKTRAEELASLLGVTNKERQTVMTDATKHAIDMLHSRTDPVKNLLIAVHEDYPEGVIGLVAGRIVEEFYRPAIVISRGEKHSKGSVRSISGFNIIEFLRNSSDFFINVGGHPMAAGFTIETDKIVLMQAALEKLAEAMDDGILVRTVKVDCEVPLSVVTQRLFESLKQLGPFGMANPEPVFVSRDVEIRDMRVLGKEGKHLRLNLSAPDAIMEAIAFGMGERAQELKTGDRIDLVYTVDENNWNGRRKLQLKVKDLQKTIK
jgi:single-stranded-DNA-specific exonuclease